MTPSPVKTPRDTSLVTSSRQQRDSDRYCQLCNAWFNNPGMAQQHYEGKKHKKNAARADLLEQLGKTLDFGEIKGTGRKEAVPIRRIPMNVTLCVSSFTWSAHRTPLITFSILRDYTVHSSRTKPIVFQSFHLKCFFFSICHDTFMNSNQLKVIPPHYVHPDIYLVYNADNPQMACLLLLQEVLMVAANG